MLQWLTGSETHPPLLWRHRSCETFVLITVSVAVFTDLFVYGIVVPVLPFALTTRTSIDPTQTQRWVAIFLAAYGAAYLVTSPICGWLADRTTTRRLPLLLGLLALGGSTVLLCVGDSVGVLATGRVLQGVSAAVVWVVGLALIVDTVGGENVGRAMGYVGLGMTLAILLGPLLGGIVFDKAGYYAVFAMAFGLVGADIVMRLVLIEKKTAARWLPCEGEIESAITKTKRSEVSAEASSNRAQKDESFEVPGQTSSRIPPIFVLLTSRRLQVALFAALVQATILTAFDSILPLFVRDTFHWDSLGAGLIFLPIVLANFTGPIIGHLSDRYGARWFATGGFILVCPVVILMRLVNSDSIQQKVLLCALLALMGLGLTLSITPIMAEITYAVDAVARSRPPGFFGKNGVYAQGYALFNMAFAGGCLVGPLLGGLINQRYGWEATTLVVGCVSAFTAVPTVIWTSGSIFDKP